MFPLGNIKSLQQFDIIVQRMRGSYVLSASFECILVIRGVQPENILLCYGVGRVSVLGVIPTNSIYYRMEPTVISLSVF